MKRLFVFLLLITASLLLPKQIWAIGEDWNSIVPGCVDTNGVATLACIPAVFKNLINFALWFAGGTALFTITIGGIRYIFSRGDPKAVEAAKSTIQWGIIGTIVIVLAFSIISFISYFTGASCFLNFGFETCK